MLMDFAFSLYTPNGTGKNYKGIRVGKRTVTISKFISNKIKHWEYAIIKFDKDNEVILLSKSKEEGYKIVYTKNSSGVLSCSISKCMPMGRYLLEQETKDGLIFSR